MKCISRYLLAGLALSCICFSYVHASPYSKLSELLLKGGKTKGLMHSVVHEASDIPLHQKAYIVALRHINRTDSIANIDYFMPNDISFDSGSVAPTKESKTALIKIADVMNAHPEIMYEILGYTDNSECNDSCSFLSAKRATFVKNVLIRFGVSEMRLTTKGMGSSQSISTDSTLDGQLPNRRVEFLRIDKAISNTQSIEPSDSLAETIIFLLIPMVLIALFITSLKQKHSKKKKEEEYYRKIAEQMDNKTNGKKTNSSFDLAKEEAEYRRLRKNARFKKEK